MAASAEGGSRTVAILGVGVMGSTLLAGLLRSGRNAADLVITGRNVERAEELAQDTWRAPHEQRRRGR